MAEVTIASHKWRLFRDEFSGLCDNTLFLDNTTGLIDDPVKLNSKGVCPPPCKMCISSSPLGLQANCFCDSIPRYYDVTFPSQVKGTDSAWSACFSVPVSARAKFVNAAEDQDKRCLWSLNLGNKKIAHQVAGNGTFACADGAGVSELSVETQRKAGSNTLGVMTVRVSLDWQNPQGDLISIPFVWSGDIEDCFGEFQIPVTQETVNFQWPVDPQNPNAGNYVLSQFFEWPGVLSVKSIQN